MSTTSASEGLRTLIIAVGEDERAALRRALERAGIAAMEDEGDPDRALARVSAEAWDVVVIDHRPAVTGVELVAAIHERAPAVAMLLVAPRFDEALERAAFDAGVTDLMSRDDLTPARLGHRLRGLRRIAQAQKAAAARDELVAVVSHDLRSPLNAIVLACDALEGAIAPDQDHRRYVAAIRRASQRAERLLRDLLDVARIESGALRLECRPVSTRAMLEQARSDHEILARDAGSQLVVDVTGDPGQVLADRDRIQQVLANLVGNALKYAAGAAIVLEARGAPDAVEISVVDGGPGIQPDALPHVFDRFWQGRARRRGGAGLGLAIARGIVLAHGGSIEVSSEVGKGTRFLIRLPRPPTAEAR